MDSDIDVTLCEKSASISSNISIYPASIANIWLYRQPVIKILSATSRVSQTLSRFQVSFLEEENVGWRLYIF